MNRIITIFLLICLGETALAGQVSINECLLLRDFSEFDKKTLTDWEDLHATFFFNENNELIIPLPKTQDYIKYQSNLKDYKRSKADIHPSGLYLYGFGLYKQSGNNYLYSDVETITFIVSQNGKESFFSKRKLSSYPGIVVGDIYIEKSDYRKEPDAYYYKNDTIDLIPISGFAEKAKAGEYKDLGLEYINGELLYWGMPWNRDQEKQLYRDHINGGIRTYFKKDNLIANYEAVYKNGVIIKIINIVEDDPNASHYDSYHAIFDLEGNIYYVYQTKLYYYGRYWGFENTRSGTINNDNVRVRLHAGAGEFLLGEAQKGNKVTVLTESEKPDTIGGVTKPWYKVKLESGLVGWVYGAFVDIK
jgi:hypothetical protein